MPFAQSGIPDIADESPRRNDSSQKLPSDSSTEEFSKMALDYCLSDAGLTTTTPPTGEGDKSRPPPPLH